MLKESILTIFENYQINKEQFKAVKGEVRKVNDYSAFHTLINELPGQIANVLGYSENYEIHGSSGVGNIAEIPWLGIFDTDITTSAQTGYYVVYLFNSDMSGVYLSLNQGWKQYKDFYGTRQGKVEIKSNAVKAKRLLTDFNDFDFEDINLSSTKDLAQGYEKGNIISKFYSKINIPNEDLLINDLHRIIEAYTKLKGIIGNSILALEDSSQEEESFQEAIQGKSIPVIPSGPLPVNGVINGPVGTKYKRKPIMGADALKKANYTCARDNTHTTFETIGKHQFMEAHHLIPIAFQDRFNNSIDIPENIISLCPNCHSFIHHGRWGPKARLIEQLYNERKTSLEGERNIFITLDELLDCYR